MVSCVPQRIHERGVAEFIHERNRLIVLLRVALSLRVNQEVLGYPCLSCEIELTEEIKFGKATTTATLRWCKLSKPLVTHLSIVIFVEWFGAGKEWVVAAMAIPYAITVCHRYNSGCSDHNQRQGVHLCQFHK